MMKRLLAAIFAVAMIACLAACGGQSAQSSSASVNSTSTVPASAATKTVDKFDGSAFTDTGDGEMILKTAGGTSEGGNVPQVASKKGMSSIQIELDYKGGNGSVCTVYIDGIENTKTNAGQRSQSAITLEGDALSEGVHVVEMVSMDGDTPTIYKKAQYEIVQ